MTTVKSVTPNLVVAAIERGAAFYRDVLGFAVKQSVPEAAPFVFLWMERDGVPLFLNDFKAAAHDLPSVATPPAGGTATDFVVTDVDALHAHVAVQPHLRRARGRLTPRSAGATNFLTLHFALRTLHFAL
jgi:catechol 2,3-dioxygenase-like lactoylglutathione lyase family enzyme